MMSLDRQKLAEIFAVILNLGYTVLYLKGSIWAWPAAFMGSLLFVWVCYKKNILAESFLHLFYVGMAVYGFLNASDEWKIIHWSFQANLPYLITGLVATFLTWKILESQTSSSLPLIDSFTTVFSIIATWIMVNYVHENWLYWIIIDAVAIVLYLKRGLYYGAFLFLVYFLLAINGYFELGWI